MKLAAMLLAVVAITHYGYAPIAAVAYQNPQEIVGAIFYVLRGLEGAALYALLIATRHGARVSAAAATVAAWGAIEELQTAVCQLAVGIDSAPRVPLWEGLCGWPMYTIGLMAIAALAVVVSMAKH